MTRILQNPCGAPRAVWISECSSVCVGFRWSGLILLAVKQTAQARKSVSTGRRRNLLQSPHGHCSRVLKRLCLSWQLQLMALRLAAPITLPVLLCLGHLPSTLLLMLRPLAAHSGVHTACQVLMSLPAHFCSSVYQVELLFGVAAPYYMCTTGVCALAGHPRRQNSHCLVDHRWMKMTLVLLRHLVRLHASVYHADSNVDMEEAAVDTTPEAA